MIKKLFQYIHYFTQSLKNRGWLFTFKLLYNEWKWEKKLGIKTLRIENLENQNLGTFQNSDTFHHYQGASYYILQNLFKKLPADTKKKLFIDLGCGKGRVLAMAQINGFSKLYGIDISIDLIEDSKKNLQFFNTSNTEITLKQADASSFQFPENTGTVFLFNPFGETVMKKVIEHALAYCQNKENKLSIVYVNPGLEQLWVKAGFRCTYVIKSKKYTEAVILESP